VFKPWKRQGSCLLALCAVYAGVVLRGFKWYFDYVGLEGGGVRVCVGDFNLAVILIGWWILPWCFGGVMGFFLLFLIWCFLLYAFCVHRDALSF
jgi:hypothetical protein